MLDTSDGRKVPLLCPEPSSFPDSLYIVKTEGCIAIFGSKEQAMRVLQGEL